MSVSPHIVLGVTGSIAAYKAAELIRLFTGKGWTVSVMMTEAATNYVGPLTFEALSGKPVVAGRFERPAGSTFPHIDFARDADVIAIAPCTANVIAKLACGLADDVVTATVLASAAPLVVAPAMNTKMWEHPATRANVALLKERGVEVTPVGEGELACGEVGAGRLCELDLIVDAVERRLPAT
jgi:phosphopantothenoylcysteine decarboxylase/phosphopantothenate--cysteine ligase